jgi:3'(2'), 5'-bisphosphate nucleotidase
VARAAGLHASRLDGSAPEYNQAHPDLLICRPKLASRLVEAVAE